MRLRVSVPAGTGIKKHTYATTKDDSVSKCISTFSISGKYYFKKYFKKEFNNILQHQRIKAHSSMKNLGLVEITMSLNLFSSLHIDYRDTCREIAIWVEKIQGSSDG